MGSIDFARLRNQTMNDGKDSEVTVNTRALIDKVLARYSSEHTTLRELIQNASDAGASTVIIRYETDPSTTIPAPQTSDKYFLLKHIIQHHTLRRLTVSNNGQPFTGADWSRLKSIADGNPDETKIGAFGVGFYSVFSDCNEPFVVSGDRTMAFYWKGNTLSTKVAVLSSEQASSDTTFFLEYRQANPSSASYNPPPIPNIPSLCQFLSTSLTFVGLQFIELHLDDHRVATFGKMISPPTEIRIPAGLKAETDGGLMRVAQITRQSSQINAVWSNVIATAQVPAKSVAEIVPEEIKNAGTSLKSFFSRFSAASSTQTNTKVTRQAPVIEKPISYGDDISGESKGSIFLQVCTVDVNTKVERGFAVEIERATKKSPPRKTKIALLTSPFHENSTSPSTGSGPTSQLSAKIFSDILPTKAGRIFIGFPTAQTTGFLAHVSAPSLIPTVERENIDMNARYISTWNAELLRVAGLACRISYMSDIAELRAKIETTAISALIPQAIYIFQQYTSKPSAPSSLVGEKIEEAFWSCSKERSIDILSSKGIIPSKLVRMPAETLRFLGEVPMVPQELANGAVSFMVNLHNRGFISDMTMEDIRKGLESRALNETELMEFLRWCGNKLTSEELDPKGVRALFSVTVAAISEGPDGDSQGTILQLIDIDSYINVSKISPTMPIPSTTIPFKFTKPIPPKELQLFGWQELSIVTWLRFLTNGPHLEKFISSEKFAMQVLGLVAKSWDQIDSSSKEAVCNLLSPHSILPTKMGMRRPEESYFPTVKLFDDLPVVKQFPSSKEKFLQALGVRRTIELSVVFERMNARDVDQETGKIPWSHVELIRYFASVMDEIPRKDIERLRQTPFLPGEGLSVKPGQLFKAADLYAPSHSIIALGLNQIKLPFELRLTTREGKLLLTLGLMEHPSALRIVAILQHAGESNNRRLYDICMEYYLQNYFKNGYEKDKERLYSLTVSYLPTEQVDFPALVAPFQCFVNENASCLGYAILRADIRPHAEKFGLQKDPPIKDCVQRLIKQPPTSKSDAEIKFGYMCSRASDLDQNRTLANDLSVAKIVPIFRKYYLQSPQAGFEDPRRRQTGPSELRIHHYDPPDSVFLGRDQEYRGMLDYVQYGPEATSFLLKVGAKHEPSSFELANMLAQNPSRFLKTMGQEKYLDLLRKLAEQGNSLWVDKQFAETLSKSRILLGYKDIKGENEKAELIEDDIFEDEGVTQREWSLNTGEEVIIVDDIYYFSKFRDFVVATPQEEVLEKFYERFGAKKMTDLVKTDRRVGNLLRDQEPAKKLRKEILERTRLFLHEYERDTSANVIRHDTKWLSSHLSVQLVSDVSVRFSLQRHAVAFSQQRSALVHKVRQGGHVLYIVPNYDKYDVSRELVMLLIKRPKQNDVIALERILTESLRRLQEKGINVERILRKREYEARIAQQSQLEKEFEENSRRVEEKKQGITNDQEPRPSSPDQAEKMPGAFGSPEPPEHTGPLGRRRSVNKGLFNKFAKSLGLSESNRTSSATDPPQITKDIQATNTNIQNAIKECRPTNMQAIKSKHHVDATELDKGGYCNDVQAENITKAFTIPYQGLNVDVYFGKFQTETPNDIHESLQAFLPVIMQLTNIFEVNPAAVNIFLDNRSNTVAFNLSGALFFNLAWFTELHLEGWNTKAGRLRGLDSWYLTYCHELAHNLVGDHNARHEWYQQSICVEFSQKFRANLPNLMGGL